MKNARQPASKIDYFTIHSAAPLPSYAKRSTEEANVENLTVNFYLDRQVTSSFWAPQTLWNIWALAGTLHIHIHEKLSKDNLFTCLYGLMSCDVQSTSDIGPKLFQSLCNSRYEFAETHIFPLHILVSFINFKYKRTFEFVLAKTLTLFPLPFLFHLFLEKKNGKRGLGIYALIFLLHPKTLTVLLPPPFSS